MIVFGVRLDSLNFQGRDDDLKCVFEKSHDFYHVFGTQSELGTAQKALGFPEDVR